MLWWLNHFGIFFPGTLISYLLPKLIIRYTSRVGSNSSLISSNLERETREEKSIWCDNRHECKSINTFPFTPKHFISCGSPKFQTAAIQNFEKLKFSKSTKCICKDNQTCFYYITLREGEVLEGLIFSMILNSMKCNFLHLFFLYLLEALEFF